jgi:hypothetical protein
MKQIKYFEQTPAIYVYNHCNMCNIGNYHCNIHMKHLKYLTHAFCNIGKAGADRFYASGWESAVCERHQTSTSTSTSTSGGGEHHHHQHH